MTRTAETALTAGRLRELLIFDQFDGRWTWARTRGGKARAGAEAGWIDMDGYRVIGVDGVRYRAARLAFLWVKGRWPKGDAEHRDGDKGNDAFLNLREATRSENNANRRLPKSNTSGWKWAYRRKGRWRAKIKVNGEDRHVGYFDSAPEAHMAAWVVAREAYGPFVRLR